MKRWKRWVFLTALNTASVNPTHILPEALLSKRINFPYYPGHSEMEHSVIYNQKHSNGYAKVQ